MLREVSRSETQYEGGTRHGQPLCSRSAAQQLPTPDFGQRGVAAHRGTAAETAAGGRPGSERALRQPPRAAPAATRAAPAAAEDGPQTPERGPAADDEGAPAAAEDQIRAAETAEAPAQWGSETAPSGRYAKTTESAGGHSQTTASGGS